MNKKKTVGLWPVSVINIEAKINFYSLPLSCKCWVQRFLFSTSYSQKGMNEWIHSNWFQAWLDGFAIPSTRWMLNQGMVLYPCNASQINKTVYTNSKPVAQDCFSTEFQLCLLHYNSYNSAHSEN